MKAGLEGFEPSTAGLRVLCATWLRYRPTQKSGNLPILILRINRVMEHILYQIYNKIIEI